MGYKASWAKRILQFNFKAVTSRGSMLQKPTYYLKIWDEANPEVFGIGECALFPGLSEEDNDTYEGTLTRLCQGIGADQKVDISRYSSIKMGLETALLDLANGGKRLPFPGPWTQGEEAITINGLVWMGSLKEMLIRLEEKLSQGFTTIKIKVGGLDRFDQEIELIDTLRLKFGPEKLTLRLDANGAFTPGNAMERLRELVPFHIHSIEQPIRPGQWDAMSWLCENSPIPIALDEELIGTFDKIEKRRLLKYISPQYIILKPTLCGGFESAGEWIEVAEKEGIGWWITSALESDIGLNAIAQWTAAIGAQGAQGLGTGQLYKNNIPSPLLLEGDKLLYNPAGEWIIPEMEWNC